MGTEGAARSRKRLWLLIWSGTLASCSSPPTGPQNAAPGSNHDAEVQTALAGPTARAWAGAAVLAGKTYLVGGGLCLTATSSCAAFGQDATKGTQVGDPTVPSWTATGNLSAARWGLAATGAGGKVYAIGGTSGTSSLPISTVEELDPATGTWHTKAAPMRTPRWKPAASANAGIIYVAGGGSSGNQCVPSRALDAYNPTTDLWTARALMPTARWGAASAVVNGILYVFGGSGQCPQTLITRLGTLEAYNPASNTWSTLSPMNVHRWDHAGIAVNGKLYAIGGYDADNQKALATVEEYNPATNKWLVRAPMPTARTGLSVTTSGGLIYAIGGFAGKTVLKVIEVYDPVRNAWSMLAPSDGAVTVLVGQTGDVGEPDAAYFDSRRTFHGKAEAPNLKWHHGADIASTTREWNPTLKRIVKNGRVVAAAAGRVVFAGCEVDHGHVVAILHTGLVGPQGFPFVYSFYSHMGQGLDGQCQPMNNGVPVASFIPLNIVPGVVVKAGTVIGCQGNSGTVTTTDPNPTPASGTHLHVEVRVSSVRYDPYTAGLRRKFDASTVNWTLAQLIQNGDLVLSSPDNYFAAPLNFAHTNIPGARVPQTTNVSGVGGCPT